MSDIIYLYLKIHNKTGLKYLGKTINDPFSYRGSGTYWLRHLGIHGDDVTTEILFETRDKDEFAKIAIEYSIRWNIVESSDFANLVNEQGDGGDTSKCDNYMTGILNRDQSGKNNPFYGKTHTAETKRKIKEARSTQIISEKTRKKLSESRKGKRHSAETRKKLAEAHKNRIVYSCNHMSEKCKQHLSVIRKEHNPGFRDKVECPHCNKIGQLAVMKRWHFDNCRNKQ